MSLFIIKNVNQIFCSHCNEIITTPEVVVCQSKDDYGNVYNEFFCDRMCCFIHRKNQTYLEKRREKDLILLANQFKTSFNDFTLHEVRR